VYNSRRVIEFRSKKPRFKSLKSGLSIPTTKTTDTFFVIQAHDLSSTKRQVTPEQEDVYQSFIRNVVKNLPEIPSLPASRSMRSMRTEIPELWTSTFPDIFPFNHLITNHGWSCKRCKRTSDESPSAVLFSSLLLAGWDFCFRSGFGRTRLCQFYHCGRFLFRLVHHRTDRPVSGQSKFSDRTVARLLHRSSHHIIRSVINCCPSSVSDSRFDHESPVDRLHYHWLVTVAM